MTQRQLAAIMFTDLVGYSALTQRDEALALELLELHWKLLRREIKTMGDAFLIEFPSALQAVQAGLAMQDVLEDYNRTVDEERRIRIRVGIHMGDVERRGDDVFGDGVNIASRIEPLAPPGGICISEPVYASVHNKLETEFQPLGERRLKNITQPIRLYSSLETPGAGAVRWSGKRSLLVASIAAVVLISTSYVMFRFSGLDSVTSSEPDEAVGMAILPFRSLNSGDENDYMGKAIAEDLLDGIAVIPGVHVKATFSSFALHDASPQKIQELLGVTRLLDGTYRMVEGSIRISVRMIDTSNGDLVWNSVTTDSLANIFEMQNSIARNIAAELGLEHPDAAQDAARRVDPVAYHQYVLAREGMVDPWRDTEKTVARIMRVLEIEPDFPEALAMLGLLNTGRAWILEDRQSPFLKTGEEYSLRALEGDPDLAEAWAVLGLSQALQYRWAEARESIDKAIQIRGERPLNVVYTLTYNNLGHVDRTRSILERIFEQDPLNPRIVQNLIYEYANIGEDRKALDVERLAIERGIPYQEDVMAQVYARQGNMVKATQLMESWTEMHGLPRSIAPNVVGALLTGRDETYEQVIDAALASGQLPLGQAIFDYIVAGADEEKVFDAAFRAMESGNLNQIAFFIPQAGRYRRSPRFLELMGKLGLLDYWQSVELPYFCRNTDGELTCT